MIPVSPQSKPLDFNATVRMPGLRWLRANGIPLDRPVPPRTKLPPYWRACLGELHVRYGGVCAYLAVFIERCTGGASVDHFVAKSRKARLAYAWSNYRLASTTMNARKRDYDTVLDPFTLVPGTFRLELVTGRIYPDPALSGAALTAAKRTLDRLGLDEPLCREMRARRYGDYLAARGAQSNAELERQLARYSPFIWSEATRQGVL